MQMRSDWVIPLCTGRRAAEGRERRQGPSDAKARGAAAPHPRRHHAIPATWCSTRSSAPAPPGRWPRCWAATSSGSSAKRPIARSPQTRLDRVRAYDRSALEITGSKRAEPRVPFGQVVERGMLRPGEVLTSAGARHTATVRADGTLMSARDQGFDPSGRRGAGRCAVLQRLDLLALHARRPDGPDRHPAPADPGRNG